MSGVQYSKELLSKAESWSVYASELTDNNGDTWPVTRCSACHNAILHQPDTAVGVAFHLIQVHGFRMDGRHEDDQATAARAAAERGEMNAYRS